MNWQKLLFSKFFYPWRFGKKKFIPPMHSIVDLWSNESIATQQIHPQDYHFFELPAKAFDHEFLWMALLIKAPDKKAKQVINDTLESWLKKFKQWHEFAWRGDILAVRLLAWLVYYDQIKAYLKSPHLSHQWQQSMQYQLTHLFLFGFWKVMPIKRFYVFRTLILAALYLEAYQKKLLWLLIELQKEIDHQILDDGFYKSLNPSEHMEVFQMLLDIVLLMEACHREVPSFLKRTIEHMAQNLYLVRHGDGGFCLFHGTNEGDSGKLDRLLKKSGQTQKPITSLKSSGYERIEADKTIIILNCQARNKGYMGLGAFEMSVGRNRVIVNCGASQEPNIAWQKALSSTAAHSTLVVDDKNMVPPLKANIQRQSREGYVWLEIEHDGYQKEFALTHQRRLYLNPEGNEIRGEDRVMGQGVFPFVLRFHLHPLVKPARLNKANQILLRLADGSGWRFIASMEDIHLEESVYFGQRGKLKPTQQIVLKADKTSYEDFLIKWALKRV